MNVRPTGSPISLPSMGFRFDGYQSTARVLKRMIWLRVHVSMFRWSKALSKPLKPRVQLSQSSGFGRISPNTASIPALTLLPTTLANKACTPHPLPQSDASSPKRAWPPHNHRNDRATPTSASKRHNQTNAGNPTSLTCGSPVAEEWARPPESRTVPPDAEEMVQKTATSSNNRSASAAAG